MSFFLLLLSNFFFPEFEDEIKSWEPISYECRYCDLQENPEYIWKKAFTIFVPTKNKDVLGVIGEDFFTCELEASIKGLNLAWYSEDEVNTPHDYNFYPFSNSVDCSHQTFQRFLLCGTQYFEGLGNLKSSILNAKPYDLSLFFIQKNFVYYSPIFAEKTVGALENAFFSYIDSTIEKAEESLYELLKEKKSDKNKMLIEYYENRLAYYRRGIPIAKSALHCTKDNFVKRVLADIDQCFLDRELNPQHHKKQCSQQFYDRGYARFLLGDFYNSMQDIELFLLTDPENPKLLQFLGETSSMLGLYQNAIECLSKVLVQQPTNKTAYLESSSSR